MFAAKQEGALAGLAEYLVVTAGFVAASCVLLYPVFSGMSVSVFAAASPLSRPIARWVMWILAWDVHAIGSSSVRLFDANVFHPVPDALAFADPLLGALPLFGPVYAMTGQPVLAYQLMLLLTLALCGASMYALARHWGCAPLASAIAGAVYAYAPARLGVLAEYSYVAGQFMPLALLFADRVAVRPTARDVLALLLFATWQMFCGTQLAYAFAISIAAYVGGTVVTGGRSWSPRGLATVLGSLALAVAFFFMLNAPYRSLQAEGLYFGRSMYEFASFGSADSWRSYLVPPYLSRLGWPLSGGSLYLGLWVLALATVGLLASATVVRRWRIVVRLLLLAVACYWMSLGPDVLGGLFSPYGVALSRIPGFAILGPAPVRFALFLMVAMAGFTAFGVEWIQSRLAGAGGGSRRRRLLVAGACLAGVLIDYRLPFQHFETQRIRYGAAELPLYATLAELPPGPLLELPVDPCAVTEDSSVLARQFASTMHWLPLLDGYRSLGRAPVTYELVRALANALPDPRALDLLHKMTGLRYVVVHLTDLAGDWRHRWRNVEGMTRVGFFGQDLLFEVTLPGQEDLQRALLDLPAALSHDRRDGVPSTTLSGTRLVEFTPQEGWAALTFTKLPPPVTMAGGLIRAEVLVENRSDRPWPALTLDRDRKVFVSYMWTDPAGHLAGGNGQAAPLPFDLEPGESVVVAVCVEVPRRDGELNLAFGLSKSQDWFPDLSERLEVTVIPGGEI